MRFDSEYRLGELDTMGAFLFTVGDDKRIIPFLYEQQLGIPPEKHDDATALFIQIAAESRREK